jgi:hypothetical protein
LKLDYPLEQREMPTSCAANLYNRSFNARIIMQQHASLFLAGDDETPADARSMRPSGPLEANSIFFFIIPKGRRTPGAARC